MPIWQPMVNNAWVIDARDHNDYGDYVPARYYHRQLLPFTIYQLLCSLWIGLAEAAAATTSQSLNEYLFHFSFSLHIANYFQHYPKTAPPLYRISSILTSNIYTYTGDQRFSIIHPPDSDDYDLKIEYAQLRDSGIYECQVNTEPKINLAVYLDVTGN